MQKWYKLTSLLVISLLFGCGFKPVYDGERTYGGKLNSIALGPIKAYGEDGKLIWALNKILAPTLHEEHSLTPPVYSLRSTISTAISSAIIQADSTVSRKNVSMTLDYELIRIADSKLIDKGTVISVDGYSATGTPFSNHIAERESKKRLLKVIAADLFNHLYAVD